MLAAARASQCLRSPRPTSRRTSGRRCRCRARATCSGRHPRRGRSARRLRPRRTSRRWSCRVPALPGEFPRAAGSPWRPRELRRSPLHDSAGSRDLGWHCLSNAACLMRPQLFVFFVVSRITIICHIIRHF